MPIFIIHNSFLIEIQLVSLIFNSQRLFRESTTWFVLRPKHDLTFKLGGNENGRNSGEWLAVDPNKGNILFLGSSKNGLWQSSYYGNSWSQVSSFPVSTFSGAGVSFVLFDKSTGTAATQTITVSFGSPWQSYRALFFQYI